MAPSRSVIFSGQLSAPLQKLRLNQPVSMTPRATRQAHREHRALARLACYGHVAAHHACELARESKAEPRPAVAARGQGICLGEFLEQFRLLFGGQADAGIRDGKLDPVASVGHLAHPQGDLALFRELTGIAQQIEQNLCRPAARLHRQGFDVFIEIGREPIRRHIAAVLLLLSWPASAEVHFDYTFSQWERLHDDDRAAYIAGFIDTLATTAATEPAQRAARHYSQCIIRSQLAARQLANFIRKYVRARPEMQGSSVQRAMNDYLNALCGRPFD
jgi:hypothetical protein